jgi:hypothetical protein
VYLSLRMSSNLKSISRVPLVDSSNSGIPDYDSDYVRVRRRELSGLVTQQPSDFPKPQLARMATVGEEKSDSRVVPGPAPGLTTANISATGDVKLQLATPGFGSGSLRGLRQRRHRDGRYTTISVDTVTRFTSTGTTGALFAPVYTLAPNNASSVTEASAFATLFDEARCIGVTAYCRVNASSAASVGGLGAWGVVFDPGNPGAYTSVTGTLLASQHLGPVSYNEQSAIQVSSQTGHGYLRFEAATMPNEPTNPNSELVGSNWFATSDTNVISGYLKACGDLVASAAISFDIFCVYHMEYRSRT